VSWFFWYWMFAFMFNAAYAILSLNRGDLFWALASAGLAWFTLYRADLVRKEKTHGNLTSSQGEVG